MKRQTKNIIIRLAASLLLMLVVSPPVFPQERPVIWWVLDCSGSMWGRTTQGPKYRTAQDMMQKTMNALPAADYGLVTFGLRQRSQCKDIEIMVSPGPDSRNAIGEVFKKIRPNGKSPIAATLEFIGNKVDPSRPNYIMLISDGIEACDGNPVAEAQALRENDAVQSVHTIWFKNTDGDSLTMQTIAHTTGGVSMAVSDVPSSPSWILKTAAPVPVVVDTPPLPPPVPQYGLIAYKAFIKKEEGYPAYGTNVIVKLPDGTELAEKSQWKGIIEEVPPGRYFVEASNDNIIHSKQCTVRAGKTAYLQFVFDFPTGKINFKCIVNGSENIHAYNTAIRAFHENGETVHMGNRWKGTIPSLPIIPIGKYKLTATNSGHEIVREVSVSEGDSTLVIFDFPLETGKIFYQCYLDSALQRPAYGVRFQIFTVPFEEVVYDDSTRWRGQSPLIPIGEYILSGYFFGLYINQRVQLYPGENVQKQLIFNVEQVRFSYECYQSNGYSPANGTEMMVHNPVGTRVEQAVGWRGSFVLPAGRYSLVTRYGGKEIRQDIILNPTIKQTSPVKIYFE